MAVTVLARIDAEDLARFRMADAVIESAKLLPNAYGRMEIEQAWVRYYQLREQFTEKYALPEDGQWDVALTTGAIVKSED